MSIQFYRGTSNRTALRQQDNIQNLEVRRQISSSRLGVSLWSCLTTLEASMPVMREIHSVEVSNSTPALKAMWTEFHFPCPELSDGLPEFPDRKSCSMASPIFYHTRVFLQLPETEITCSVGRCLSPQESHKPAMPSMSPIQLDGPFHLWCRPTLFAWACLASSLNN